MTVAYHLDPGLLPDLSRAACRDADPELFFTDGRTEQAKSVCVGCPDADPCLAYALRTRAAGVWGGTDEAERALLGDRTWACFPYLPDHGWGRHGQGWPKVIALRRRRRP